MPKAVIRGEIHASRSDQSDLEETAFERYDAVFREQVEGFSVENLNLQYILYLIGMLEYSYIGRKIYFSPDTFLDVAREKGIPIHTMDAPVYEQSKMMGKGKAMILGILAFYLSFSLFQTMSGFLLQFAGPSGSSQLFAVFLAALFPVGAFPLLYLLFAVQATIIDRDRYMAQQVREISEENGYDTVFVSCGDCHRPAIKRLLEAEGWTVEMERSKSGAALPSVFLCAVMVAVFSPIRTLKQVFPQLDRS